MNCFFKGMAVVMIAGTAMAANAQNRWNVYAGGSISHLCEKPWISSDKSYGWGGGAFVGGGYEINFNNHWNLSPQLEIAFVNNGASLSAKELDFYANHASWLSTWQLNIPVLAGYRFAVSESANMKIAAGPYLQEALAGKVYKNGTDEKESASGNFSNRFNVGAMGELAVETGSHFSYMLRASYPFLKEGWIRKTLTLSIGVRYSF